MLAGRTASHVSMQYRLRIGMLRRPGIIYWTWWDLINTALFVIFVSIALIALSLDLIGLVPDTVLPATFRRTSENMDWGIKLLGITLSAGSAAGFWILARSSERWAVINRIKYISNGFLRYFGREGALHLPSTYLSTTQDIEHIRSSGSLLEAYPWSHFMIGDKILLVNGAAQKNIDSAIFYCRVYQQELSRLATGSDLSAATADRLDKYFSFIYLHCCLSVIFLNRTPESDSLLFTACLEIIDRASGSDPAARELKDELSGFRKRAKS